MEQSNSSLFAPRKEENATFIYNVVQPESFWKDCVPKNNASLATPILDEFCEEYFWSVKDTEMNRCKEKDTSFIHSRVLDPNGNLDELQEFNQQKSATIKTGHCWNSPHPQPPAYQYFYHDDARIQALVRRRFCYFTPIRAENHQGNHHSTTENLDYMGQFGTRQAPTQACGTLKSAAENLEFCEEYFRSVKDTKMNCCEEKDTSFIHSRVLDPDGDLDEFQEFNHQRSTTVKTGNCWNSPHPQPPAYQYFYHDDARIQALVRRRFCYFTPIGSEKHQGNHHSTTENLDYRGQFGTRQAPTQARGTPESAAEYFEFCEEYFRSVKDTKMNPCKEKDKSFIHSRVLDPDGDLDEFKEFNQQRSTTIKTGHCWNSRHPQPPAYQYFYHDDARIQALVHKRFCYFTPIGAEKH